MAATPGKYGEILTIVQIGFYTVGATVAILTYRAAKRGLLNSVNTEYQKRVIDRLQRLSEDLYSEFDPKSPDYWATVNYVEAAIKDINEAFAEHRAAILEDGEFPFGMRVGKDEERLSRLLDPIRSDPFIPENIRSAVVVFLDSRLSVLIETRFDVLGKYCQDLAKEKRQPASEYSGIHNQILEEQRLRGCGISEIEEDVHGIRALIQDYFDSFNPHRRWWQRKRERRVRKQKAIGDS